VIDVALLGIIRRWHLREQVPLREIARRLGISRHTVRRYIRAETIESAYADRRPRSSLDKYTLKLSAWLKTEAAKSRKHRRTLKQLHLELRALGYEGSYDRVAAFATRWKVDQLERGNSASKSTSARTLSCPKLCSANNSVAGPNIGLWVASFYRCGPKKELSDCFNGFWLGLVIRRSAHGKGPLKSGLFLWT